VEIGQLPLQIIPVTIKIQTYYTIFCIEYVYFLKLYRGYL
jgi:hypothetical protein